MLIRKNLIPETSNSHRPHQPACIKNPDHPKIDQPITPLYAWPICAFFFLKCIETFGRDISLLQMKMRVILAAIS